MKLWKLAIMTAVTLAAAGAALAQTPAAAEPLTAGVQAYKNADYSLALQKLQEALANLERYSKLQIAECRSYLAMSYIAYGDTDAARDNFVMALENNPSLDFDRKMTSPKILTVFDQAKAIYLARHAEKKPAPPAAAKPEPAGEGQRIAGWTLIGVGGAAAAASAVFYGLVWQEAAKYKTANTKTRADRDKRQALTDETISACAAGLAVASLGVGIPLVAVAPRAQTGAGASNSRRVAASHVSGFYVSLGWQFR